MKSQTKLACAAQISKLASTASSNTSSRDQRLRFARLRSLSSALVVGSAIALTGCASNSAQNRGYESSPVAGAVESGYIDDVQYFQGSASTTGAGAIIGGVAGGVIGNQIGGGVGNTVATVAGVVGGALLGNEIERNNQNAGQYAMVRVRLDNGARIEIRQQSDFGLRAGDRVRVYDRQRITRG